jgi:hypothetical protein
MAEMLGACMAEMRNALTLPHFSPKRVELRRSKQNVACAFV